MKLKEQRNGRRKSYEIYGEISNGRNNGGIRDQREWTSYNAIRVINCFVDYLRRSSVTHFAGLFERDKRSKSRDREKKKLR